MTGRRLDWDKARRDSGFVPWYQSVAYDIEEKSTAPKPRKAKPVKAATTVQKEEKRFSKKSSKTHAERLAKWKAARRLKRP